MFSIHVKANITNLVAVARSTQNRFGFTCEYHLVGTLCTCSRSGIKSLVCRIASIKVVSLDACLVVPSFMLITTGSINAKDLVRGVPCGGDE